MTSSVKRRRRPRGSLTRERIVDAALSLADEDGLDALSMPALARRLDCGVMTIYGYIDSKEALLDAIALRGLADVRLPRPLPRQPKAVLVSWGRSLRSVLLEHPSLSMVFLSRAVVGPGIFRGIEALLGALTRGGIAPATGVHAVYAVVIYATGFVAWELPRTHRQTHAAYSAHWRREFASLPLQDFPITGGVLDRLSDVAGEEQFEFGLAALADGLTARARRRS